MDARHWTGEDDRNLDVEDRDAPILSHLTYASYKAQRLAAPYVAPWRWEAVFQDAEAMEARYQAELGAYALRLLSEAGLSW